jgi:hypothetical protein
MQLFLKSITALSKKYIPHDKLNEGGLIDSEVALYMNKYSSIKEYYSRLSSKMNDMSEVIFNVILVSIKNISQQTQTELKEIELTFNSSLKEINEKEIGLQTLSEKYINQKKTLDKLIQNLNNSKPKDKYEIIVKLEMDIKIATKTLNELKSVLSSAADEYREVRHTFSKKSLILYINIIKIIEREYEAIRALLISFVELIQEMINIKNVNEYKFTNDNNRIIPILDNQFNDIKYEELNNITMILNSSHNKFKTLYDSKLDNIAKLINIIQTFILFGNSMIKFLNEVNSQKQQNIIIDPDSSEFMTTMMKYNKIMKDYFQLYVSSLTELNNDTNINLSKINELQKILKEKYSAIIKKLESTSAIITKDIKIIHKEKNESTRNEMIVQLKDYLNGEYNNIQANLNNFEFLCNEANSIIYTNINIFTSVINFKESEMFGESSNYVKRLNQIISETKFSRGSDEFKNLVYNYNNIEENFERYKEIINSEIIDFLSFRKDIKFTLHHERKCVMYNEQFESGSDNNIAVKHYFSKIKDLIVKKFKNLKSKSNLFENIDLIMSDSNNPKEKEFENYVINNSVYNKKEEAVWFNKLLVTWFNRWKDSEIFLHWFKKYLYRIYNKKRPENLDTIYIDDVKLSGSMPYFKSFKELEFEKKSDFEVNGFNLVSSRY